MKGELLSMDRKIVERSIPLYIILTIITCGLFGIYWLIVMADDMNALANDGDNTSGAVVFLLTLVTCGIYGWFWVYKQGQRVDRLNGTQANTGIIYIILNVVGLSIVTYALIQNELNKRASSVEM